MLKAVFCTAIALKKYLARWVKIFWVQFWKKSQPTKFFMSATVQLLSLRLHSMNGWSALFASLFSVLPWPISRSFDIFFPFITPHVDLRKYNFVWEIYSVRHFLHFAVLNLVETICKYINLNTLLFGVSWKYQFLATTLSAKTTALLWMRYLWLKYLYAESRNNYTNENVIGSPCRTLAFNRPLTSIIRKTLVSNRKLTRLRPANVYNLTRVVVVNFP